MTGPISSKFNLKRKPLSTLTEIVAISTLLIGFLRVMQLTAQSPIQSETAFEAASIRPSDPHNLRGSTFEFIPGGSLRIRNGTLKGIIETAYGVRDFQILGGPAWVNSERYDVFAKSPDGERTATADPTEEIKATRVKVQALLARRFGLKLRRVNKEVSGYRLVIGKNGARLAEHDVSNVPPNARSGIETRCGEMIGTSTTMVNLTVMLSRQLSRPVWDRTGLQGKY